MRKINRKFKKMIDQVIVQGNNNEIQELFNTIFQSMREEFTEDNLPGLTSFMLEITLRSWRNYILKTEHDYGFDFNNFGDMLKSCVNTEIKELNRRSHRKQGE